jgi:hypothetical protein
MVKPPEKVIFVLCLYSLYAVYQALTTVGKVALLLSFPQAGHFLACVELSWAQPTTTPHTRIERAAGATLRFETATC